MNLLTESLPYYITVNGEDYPLETNFRVSVRFELLMQDSGIDEADKAYIALRMYLKGNQPDDPMAALGGIINFYRCANEAKTTNSGRESGMANGNSPTACMPMYSFEHDGGYIYAAFLAYYGIDLVEVKYLHWWKFRALFTALPQDCEFCKIIGYRAMTISKNMSEEQKKFYKKMKRIYALPDNRTAEQKETDFMATLAKII